ncbi:Eco57I restriction-modification methylase domain-containing protein [Fusobacterium sp.]|uniref:Eco57I restriction-modification methylase domain-containing protein n=1 Tax=Fusobacterium sp. TaxID=68766 RepID=UPI00396C71E0
MKKDLNYSIYTPDSVAQEMIDHVFHVYFSKGEKKQQLENIRVCDISCGSGNLLIPAVKKLLELSKKIYGEYRFNPLWISGYDLDKEAVNIANDKITSILKQAGIEINLNITKFNALELKENKYNIIIGNPPYLGEKNNKEIFQKIKNTEFGKKYYESKMDYFYFFIEKAVELLEKDGLLIYLTTNYWLRADGGIILRETLKTNGQFLKMSIYDQSLFSEAIGQHNIIFLWEKNIGQNKLIDVNVTGKKFKISNSEIYDKNNKIVLADKDEREFSQKILAKSNFYLSDLVNINQGIISGHDKAFVLSEYKNEFKEYLKPFYKSKDINKYTHKDNSYWILYLDKTSELDHKVEQYLKPFYEKLCNRREVKKERIKWWQLQWAREQEMFQGPKILVRQRYKTNDFSYSEKEFYGSADIYFITPKKADINIFYILGFMNSKLFLQWFKFNGKFKGKNYEFYSTPLKETPVYYPECSQQLDYIETLVKKQIKDYSFHTQQEIDNYFYKIYNINLKKGGDI